VNCDRNGPGWTEPPTPAYPFLPVAPTRADLGDRSSGRDAGGDHFASLARRFWAAPLAAALLAGVLVLAFGAGWLHAVPVGADALLTGFSLGVLAASLALGAWQHRVIVRPLRRLAGSVGRPGTTVAVPPGPPVPQDLALLDARLAPVRAPAARSGTGSRRC
jgi:hypothetical protein